MYVFAGYQNELKVNNLWVFNLEDKSWNDIYSFEAKPCARAGHSAVVWGDKMCIFGGVDCKDKRLNDTWLFNFVN